MGNSTPTRHKIRNGLTLPILGAPNTGAIQDLADIQAVALLADDYRGMKPSMRVKAGDSVKRGQPLFEDKKNPGVLYTSPGAGTVTAVNRGDFRALQSVIVALDSTDEGSPEKEVQYSSFNSAGVQGMSSDDVRSLLVESGMWTAFRTRPFSKVPAVDARPRSIFVTAMDSNPLAPPVLTVMGGRERLFEAGLQAIVKLADGRPVHLCRADDAQVPGEDTAGVTVHAFSGKHPAGTAGIHIHRIDPVSRERVVWHLGYQDVIAIGGLMTTGRLHLERVISFAGPAVKNPGMFRVRLGASLAGLTAATLSCEKPAVISGSVFNGRAASGEIFGFLGRYHNQVSVLADEAPRRFLGWLAPGVNAFSVTRLFLSKLIPGKKFALTTDRNGGHRTMVPFANYEQAMSFDLMPVFLLRSLLSKDVEGAEELGCLELDEEDLALCTFVCPSKIEYGPALREVLTLIEKEG